MAVLVSVWHHLHVHVTRHIGLPVSSRTCHQVEPQENKSKSHSHNTRLDDTIAPARALCSANLASTDPPRRQRQLERILSWTNSNTLHATGAFSRSNLQEAVNRQA